MQVVNGYVCQTCCDVSLAQKGIDPAHPEDNPQSLTYDPQAAASRKDPAVRFGGAFAGLDASSNTTANGSATQRPAQPGDRLNISA